MDADIVQLLRANSILAEVGGRARADTAYRRAFAGDSLIGIIFLAVFIIVPAIAAKAVGF